MVTQRRFNDYFYCVIYGNTKMSWMIIFTVLFMVIQGRFNDYLCCVIFGNDYSMIILDNPNDSMIIFGKTKTIQWLFLVTQDDSMSTNQIGGCNSIITFGNTNTIQWLF